MFHSRSSSVVASSVVSLSLVLLAAMGAEAYPTVAQQCRATKSKLAGQYGACRQNAEARLATLGDSEGYTRTLAKCATKFGSAWQKAIDRAAGSGGTCSDAALASSDFQTLIDEHSRTIGTALRGGGLSSCTADLGSCHADLTTCESGLGTCNGDLATCEDDLATRDGNLATCEGGLGTCQDDLAICVAGTCGNGTLDSGEDCDIDNLNGKTCVTQGFVAGRLHCGAGCTFDTSLCFPTRFWDLGFTVLDIQTGLEWEKKFESAGEPTDPRDVTHAYTWGDLPGCSFVGCPNGTVFTDFLGRMNTCRANVGSPGSTSGECGWRLPTAQELKSIVDLTVPGCGTYPYTCIDPVFESTSPDGAYVSSTNDASAPGNVLGVQFSDGAVVSVQKAFSWFVRAVRDGPVAIAA